MTEMFPSIDKLLIRDIINDQNMNSGRIIEILLNVNTDNQPKIMTKKKDEDLIEFSDE